MTTPTPLTTEPTDTADELPLAAPILSQTTFYEMEGVFESMKLNSVPMAMLSFADDNRCIVQSGTAYAIAKQLATSLPDQEREYTWSSAPIHSAATIRILTPYEYKLQWLANYFQVSTLTIQGYLSMSPIEQCRREAFNGYIDYTPPSDAQLNLYLDDDLF